MSQYVALGSSFAAGPLLGRRAAGSPLRAGRSAVNYAHLLADRLGLDLTDVSWSGATAAQIVDGAQIEAVTAGTTLVTVTCGGNDVGYLPRLSAASLPWPFRAAVRHRVDEYERTADQKLEKLATTFDRLTAEIRRRAPQAQILLVDYLTILPPAGRHDTAPIPPDVAEWGRRIAQGIADTTRDAAERAGCSYVSASTASADHHAWSDEPWTRRFRPSLHDGASYHPNAAGMRAVADLLQTETQN